MLSVLKRRSRGTERVLGRARARCRRGADAVSLHRVSHACLSSCVCAHARATACARVRVGVGARLFIGVRTRASACLCPSMRGFMSAHVRGFGHFHRIAFFTCVCSTRVVAQLIAVRALSWHGRDMRCSWLGPRRRYAAARACLRLCQSTPRVPDCHCALCLSHGVDSGRCH
jgi:hypothetical protein